MTILIIISSYANVIDSKRHVEKILMTYPPLRLEGLPFELEWDPLPNCTMGSSNSFEWRKIIFGMITSMGIRHVKTLILRGKAFDETRAKVIQDLAIPQSPQELFDPFEA
ncbi:hypothetical protein Tco_1341252 [Tanacetum coccineum]